MQEKQDCIIHTVLITTRKGWTIGIHSSLDEPQSYGQGKDVKKVHTDST